MTDLELFEDMVRLSGIKVEKEIFTTETVLKIRNYHDIKFDDKGRFKFVTMIKGVQATKPVNHSDEDVREVLDELNILRDFYKYTGKTTIKAEPISGTFFIIDFVNGYFSSIFKTNSNVDNIGDSRSVNYKSEDIKQTKECTCLSRDLFNFGCKCGAFVK